MERLRALGQLLEASLLQRLGEAVHQAPHVPGPELLMPWRAPLLEHVGDVRIRAHARSDGLDQIVSDAADSNEYTRCVSPRTSLPMTRLLIFASFVLTTCCFSAPDEKDFTPLFNGRDLSGWRHFGKVQRNNSWQV